MIIMDTCAIIWDALDKAKITPIALKAIDTADTHSALIVADISFLEIAMLINKRRLKIAATPAHFLNLFLQSRNISVIAISPEIAELSMTLGSDINKDPTDRIIAATSIVHNAQLITADKNLLNNELIDTVW